MSFTNAEKSFFFPSCGVYFLFVSYQNVFLRFLFLVFFNSTPQLKQSAINISDASLGTVNRLKCVLYIFNALYFCTNAALANKQYCIFKFGAGFHERNLDSVGFS